MKNEKIFMRLFGRKRENEPIETEIKDLDKLSLGEDLNTSELPPELTEIKETAEAEAEEITERMEEPEMIEPTEHVEEVEFEEAPLKELDERVERELKQVKDRIRDLGSLNKLTLESPEMIQLMDLYTEYRNKLSQFIEEVNSMELTALSSNKTFAAIYKFRICKGLSEIKKHIKKIETTCKKAGFIPTKVHEILESRAEDLVDEFLGKSKGE